MSNQVLYQNDRVLFNAVMPYQMTYGKYMRKVINESKIALRSRAYATTETIDGKFTNTIILSYGEGEVKITTLIAINPELKTKEIVGAYPCFEGNGEYTIYAVIEKVVEWDNQMEASVYASFNGMKFCFFATDYYEHRYMYKEGKILPIVPAALGLVVMKTDEDLTLEGDDALTWYSKTGTKPKYDKDGKAKPTTLFIEHLVSYMPMDNRRPDVAEFQSPSIFEDEDILMDEKFTKVKIVLQRNKNGMLTIPLYFHKGFVPLYGLGNPLQGKLWITGKINTEWNINEEKIEKKNDYTTLGIMADGIATAMEKISVKKANNLNRYLPLFNKLKMRKGYILAAYEMGNEYGSRYIPYCRPADLPPIRRILTNDESKKISPVLKSFEVPFTEEAIMQAWLLEHLTDFMPKKWHANYGNRQYIFTKYDLEGLTNSESIPSNIRQSLKTVKLSDVMPSVKRDKFSALLSYTYWSPWGGLIKSSVSVIRNRLTVFFGEPETTTLAYYNCGIRF